MDGVIVINKPVDITSFQVVSKVKRTTKEKKAGHTGTLDPMATGVLPIVLGKATKLSDYIMEGTKEYIAEITFGKSYDTLDITGNITQESTEEEIKSSNVFNEKKLNEALSKFIGKQDQIPPMFSAIKKDGVKMYNLARKGIEIELEPRKIEIYEIEVLDITYPKIKIRVSCSKGTYIRSLIRDIGKVFNINCAMSSLERTKTGSFNISDSVKLDDLTCETSEKFLIYLEDLLSDFQKIELEDKFIHLLSNGVKVRDLKVLNRLKENTKYRLYDEKNTFLGLIKYEEGAVTQIFRV